MRPHWSKIFRSRPKFGGSHIGNFIATGSAEEACSVACVATYSCVSFTVKPDNNRCQLYGKAYATARFRVDSPTKVFYYTLPCLAACPSSFTGLSDFTAVPGSRPKHGSSWFAKITAARTGDPEVDVLDCAAACRAVVFRAYPPIRPGSRSGAAANKTRHGKARQRKTNKTC